MGGDLSGEGTNTDSRYPSNRKKTGWLMFKKNYRVRNWAQYNRALVRRGDLTFWFSAEIVADWKNDHSKPHHGNQKYSDAVILCGLIIKQVYSLTLRSTEGMMRSILELMRLNRVAPDYTTICRRGKTLAVPLKSLEVPGPRHVLVDSTGVRVVGEGEWKILIHGKEKHQVWRKLHIAIDADNLMILSAEMSDSVRLDCNYLPALISQISGPIGQITGDGAYDKKCCYQTALEREAKPVFPPQHNATMQRNKYKKDPALSLRDSVIKFIGNGPDKGERKAEWMRTNNYHRRSLAETTMSRLKLIFGDEMRSKCRDNQITELRTRCLVINLMNKLGLPQSMAIK
jgi:Transposase DDE domain